MVRRTELRAATHPGASGLAPIDRPACAGSAGGGNPHARCQQAAVQARSASARPGVRKPRSLLADSQPRLPNQPGPGGSHPNRRPVPASSAYRMGSWLPTEPAPECGTALSIRECVLVVSAKHRVRLGLPAGRWPEAPLRSAQGVRSPPRPTKRRHGDATPTAPVGPRQGEPSLLHDAPRERSATDRDHRDVLASPRASCR